MYFKNKKIVIVYEEEDLFSIDKVKSMILSSGMSILEGGDKFSQVNISEITDIENNNYYIIVGQNTFLEEKLKQFNLKIFKDYIFDWILEVAPNNEVINYEKMQDIIREKGGEPNYYWSILEQNKKLVYIYGNCQISSIAQHLLRSKVFREQYYIVSSKPVHRLDLDTRNRGIEKEFLKLLSIFIYQYVSENNKYSTLLATSFLEKNLKENCVRICIPNMYFTGYYPQFCKRVDSPLSEVEKFGNGLIPYGDALIEEMAKDYSEQKISLHEIVDRMSSKELFSKGVIESNSRESLDELKKREKNCNIKISDYIEKEWTHKRLFYSVNHPANILFSEMAKRILVYLEEDTNFEDRNIGELDEIEQLIFPCVARIMNFQFTSDYFYFHKKYHNAKYNLREYVATYLKEFLYHEEIYKKKKKTRNVSDLIIYDDLYITFQKPPVLTFHENQGHLAIMFKVRNVIKNEVVAWLPYKLAPASPYVSFCVSNKGEMCPISISDIGEIRVNMCSYSSNIKEDFFIMDTFYHGKK